MALERLLHALENNYKVTVRYGRSGDEKAELLVSWVEPASTIAGHARAQFGIPQHLPCKLLFNNGPVDLDEPLRFILWRSFKDPSDSMSNEFQLVCSPGQGVVNPKCFCEDCPVGSESLS